MKMKNLLLVIIATLGLSTSMMAQNLPNYIPANGLVGWWPFNENANDESGNGNNGTVNGATLTADRNGLANSAYGFSAGTILVAHNNLLAFNSNQGFSVSFWLKKNAPFGLSHFIGKRTGCSNSTFNWQFAEDNLNNWKLTFAGSINSGFPYGVATNNANLSVGNWNNITGVYDQGTYSLYLNGNLIADTVFAVAPDQGGSLIFGRSGSCVGFDGSLDDIGIWNRAKTQQEITALYNASNCSSNSAINPQINSLSTGSTATFNATTSDPNPSYVWQSNLGQGFQTLNDLENYSGTNTSSLSIANVQLSEHNQPIRVITTSGECVDTSDIATISILDTCVTSINDTTFITVTDTLVINTLITGINPPNNSNTIKVYPNPSNSHITIEYGDFAIMNGYQLRIENSLGQEVFQTSITQESDYLNLNSWGGNGLYFVHIVDPQGNTIDIRKIVLQ